MNEEFAGMLDKIVDDFFAAHPDEPRTNMVAYIVTALEQKAEELEGEDDASDASVETAA